MSGPQWLYQRAFSATSQFDENVVPEECCAEARYTAKKTMHNLLVSASSGRIGNVIDCKDYSSFHKLLRVTALVIMSILVLKKRIHMQSLTVSSDIDRSRALWI